jgi:outer membrane protein
MTIKLVRFLVASAFLLSAAFAQTDNSNAPALPAAPSAANAANSTAPADPALGVGKIVTINIQDAILACNEGQRDFEALNKKLEPKQTELKNMNDEVESLKKQLNTGGDKLSEDARGNLVKQIEQKQKALERAVQDARDDAQNQQQEIGNRILQKMGPVIIKYAADKSLGLIVDTSNPWPNGPVLWAAPSVDITKAIVDAYNVQSGVPAPAKPAAATKPNTSKPVTTAPANKPATSTTPPASPQPKQ